MTSRGSPLYKALPETETHPQVAEINPFRRVIAALPVTGGGLCAFVAANRALSPMADQLGDLLRDTNIRSLLLPHPGRHFARPSALLKLIND